MASASSRGPRALRATLDADLAPDEDPALDPQRDRTASPEGPFAQVEGVVERHRLEVLSAWRDVPDRVVEPAARLATVPRPVQAVARRVEQELAAGQREAAITREELAALDRLE